jgi:hypothetical protein
MGKKGRTMDMDLRDEFSRLWAGHFNGAEMPICFYYTDEPDPAPLPSVRGHVCIIGQLARVRRGETLCFDRDAVGCFGGKRYLGFTQEVSPDFAHFLSCGIPGRVEGERYKKSPEIVRQAFDNVEPFVAPARYVIFKRWDRLEAGDDPAVVIFFATPDVLSGLFTLAGFDETDPNAVEAPFGAGCATIARYPYLEKDSEHPKAFIGMFDVSARPFVPPGVLTFAVPMVKFARMVANIPESFLTTASWAKVRARIAGQSAGG